MPTAIPPFSAIDRYPMTGDASKQWYSVRNRSGKKIPPFAVMQLCNSKLESGEATKFYSQGMAGDSVVWDVTQCDDDGVLENVPQRFLINGRYQIAEDGFGRGTWTFPCQVLHDGEKDSIINFAECGPLPGSWYMWRNGRGFRCLSHDIAKPYEEKDGRIHTMWVQPSDTPVQAFARSTGAPSPVQAGEWLDFSLNEGALQDDESLYELLYGFSKPDDDDEIQTAWKATIGGRYMVSLSSVIYCADQATRGSRLALRIMVWRSIAKEWWNTGYVAHRYQAVEEADYSVIKGIELEQVSVTGVIPLAAGDLLAVKNESAVAVSLDAPQLTVERVGNLTNLKAVDNTGVRWP